MKTTKVLYLEFNNSSTATANIFIPYAVKHIHVRSIVYQRAGVAVGAAEYGVLLSSLISNDPLGVFFNDSTYAGFGNYTMYEYKTPTMINGLYTFTMYDASGVLMTPVNNPDYIMVLLEFEDAEGSNL